MNDTLTSSRLLTCGDCGHTVTAEIKKAKYVYYHCTAYGKLHKPTYVPEEKIDQQLGRIVGQAALPFELYDFLKTALESELGRRRIRTSGERDRLETERQTIETRMRKAYRDMLDGTVDSVFFKSIYRDYQSQLDSVRYRLANLPDCLQQDFDVAMKAIELSYQAESLYPKANSTQKRKLVRSVLSNRLLHGATLSPTYKKPFDIFAEGVQSGNKRASQDEFLKSIASTEVVGQRAVYLAQMTSLASAFAASV